MNCEEKLVEAVRSFPCRDRQLRSATSAFLTKVMELPSLTPSAKYCSHPNASSVTYILLRRKYRAKFSKKIYSVSCPSSLLLNEYHVIDRVEYESPLDAAQRERFSKIVN